MFVFLYCVWLTSNNTGTSHTEKEKETGTRGMMNRITQQVIEVTEVRKEGRVSGHLMHLLVHRNEMVEFLFCQSNQKKLIQPTNHYIEKSHRECYHFL